MERPIDVASRLNTALQQLAKDPQAMAPAVRDYILAHSELLVELLTPDEAPAKVRDESVPPPGWVHEMLPPRGFKDDEPHTYVLRTARWTKREDAARDAHRLLCEHGYAPAGGDERVREAIAKLDALRTAVDVSALAHRDAALLDRKLSEVVALLEGKTR